MTQLSRRRLLGRNGFSASVLLAVMATTGCSSIGPNRAAVDKAPTHSAMRGIQIIDLDDSMARQLSAVATPGFADTLGGATPIGSVVQPGDVLEIMILEAPPAVLFGSAALGFGAVGASSATTLPQYMVQQSGVISVPFAGIIQATGRTLPEIERTIVSRLQGKAHLPQVMVRLVQNHSANVTVVGEVATSVRMPLTPKGEQLLDALAAAGGAKQSVEKMTIQITRDGMVQSMPLSAIIADPRQNIVLKSNDVVTALYQPYSFTVLGAVGKNDELHFEATGITLSQAMGRVSGLMDGRADPKGVFLFRWEYPAALPAHSADVVPDVNGRIPVIYRVNMKDPATYLAMQHFQIRDKDVMYVSINPITEFQRVFSLISSSFLPALTAERTLNRN